MRSLGPGCRGEVVCPTHHFSKPHCRLIKTMPPFAFCIWRQKNNELAWKHCRKELPTGIISNFRSFYRTYCTSGRPLAAFARNLGHAISSAGSLPQAGSIGRSGIA
eukprot:jgi/Mesvir1/10125/Mv25523-RA.1